MAALHTRLRLTGDRAGLERELRRLVPIDRYRWMRAALRHLNVKIIVPTIFSGRESICSALAASTAKHCHPPAETITRLFAAVADTIPRRP